MRNRGVGWLCKNPHTHTLPGDAKQLQSLSAPWNSLLKRSLSCTGNPVLIEIRVECENNKKKTITRVRYFDSLCLTVPISVPLMVSNEPPLVTGCAYYTETKQWAVSGTGLAVN